MTSGRFGPPVPTRSLTSFETKFQAQFLGTARVGRKLVHVRLPPLALARNGSESIPPLQTVGGSQKSEILTVSLPTARLRISASAVAPIRREWRTPEARSLVGQPVFRQDDRSHAEGVRIDLLPLR